MGIPVWVTRRRLPQKHHYITISSRTDGVILTPEVVHSVINLHGLDRVDHVIRNNNGVVFFVCESVIAIAYVELPQPEKDVILKLRYEVLKPASEKGRARLQRNVTFTFTGGSSLFSRRSANRSIGLL
jgi:hypothetical protein